jgi:hypothetical protein
VDYNKVIQEIVVKFNKTFDTNYSITFDTRENIIKSNPTFSISKTASGCYDVGTKRIFLFSDVIDKINYKNYDNQNGTYNNGLAFLIMACFHELQHRMQFEHPEKLKKQEHYAREMYGIESFIIKHRNDCPELMEFDYKKFHDNFLLEIDADIKGVNNAIAFSRAWNFNCINHKYYEIFRQYNEYRMQNYDILAMVNQFLKIAKNRKPNDTLPSQALKFFDRAGNLKKISEMMEVKGSSIIQYVVASKDFLSSIEQSELTKEQCGFLIDCISEVLREHYSKKAFVDANRERTNVIIGELKNFTQVSANGNSSKTSDSLSSEQYYLYLYSKLGSLQAMRFNGRKLK